MDVLQMGDISLAKREREKKKKIPQGHTISATKSISLPISKKEKEKKLQKNATSSNDMYYK